MPLEYDFIKTGKEDCISICIDDEDSSKHLKLLEVDVLKAIEPLPQRVTAEQIIDNVKKILTEDYSDLYIMAGIGALIADGYLKIVSK